MNGIILIDKPLGLSSQAVVSRVKRILNIKKAGHAGTLDPLATGLLVVMLNQATKLSDYIINDNKIYEATILLGKSTTTEDSEGDIIAEKKVNEISNLDEVMKSFVGEISQTPPMYSSVRHEGRKLYQYAREDIEVTRKARTINIYSIKQSSPIVYQNGEAEFSFITKVSKGTYIRTLCVEIGRKLNYPAYMKELRRIKSGKWLLDDACSLEDLEKGNYKIIPMLEALQDFHHYEANKTEYDIVLNGGELPYPLEGVNENLETIVITYNNELVAIYSKDKSFYKARRVWN